MLVRELSVVESLFGLELELPALGKFWIQSTLRNDGVVLEAYLNGGSNPRLVGILALMLKRGGNHRVCFRGRTVPGPRSGHPTGAGRSFPG